MIARRTARPLAAGLCAIPLLAGCSGSHPADPHTAAAPLPAAAAAADPHTGLVAAFRGTLDPSAGTLALEPVERAGAAIGDTFSEVGLTRAFNGQAGFGRHFWAEAIRQPSPTTLEVDFAVRHPFAADRRPDLAIFNMKLWVVPEVPSTTVAGVEGVPGFVTNPDGYGDMWGLTATTIPPAAAETLPYVILHEDPSSGPFDWRQPAGWNVLFPGQASVDTVALDLGGIAPGPIAVHLYLTADYGQSAVRATRQDPQYSLPEFAGNAPWKVQVTELANTLEEGNTASTADYRLDIWDWKHGHGVGSDVSSVQVFAPAVMPAPLTPALAGTGTDPDPLTANFTLVNNLNASAGDYWGLVAVSDQASGVALKEDLVTPVSAAYTTYQWFPITVGGVTSTPPTAAIARCKSNPLKVGIEDAFDGSGSTPGTNPIATYEWDFDYQAGNFTPMATGPTGSFAWSTPGSYLVALRVSDGGGANDIETVAVQVSGTPTWGAPVRLTNNSFQDQFGGLLDSAHHSMAVGPDGVAHLLFSYYTFSPTFNTLTFHAAVGGCNPLAWSTPELVYASPSGQYSRVASIVVTSDNQLHAAIAKGTTAPYAYTTNPGTGWSPLVDIVPTPSPSPFAQWTTGSLAVSGPDKLGFLAIQSRPQACSGSTPLPAVPYEVWFVERTGTSWGAPIQVGLADLIVSMTCPGPGSTGNVYGSGITLAGTAGGEWIAVWDSLTTPYNGTNPQPSDSPTKIKWNRTAAGVWAGEADLFTTASYRSPKLARSPNGTVWLVARQGTGGDLAMASHNGTTWTPSPTTVLSPATGSFPYFSVHFDPDGRGILSHSQQVFGSNPSVKLFSQSDSLAAVAGMTTVALESTLSLARYPAVAVPLGDGRYAAAWATAKYGPNTFHSSGTEIDTAVFE